MRFVDCDIPGPLIIEPKVFGDDRGFFLESWNRAAFADAGLDVTFVQDNHSRSSRGVLRGLHYQNPNAQGKLVRVVNGRVFDVASIFAARARPSAAGSASNSVQPISGCYGYRQALHTAF